MLLFEIYKEKNPTQQYNNAHRRASTALHVHVCNTEDEHMRKIKCTPNACWWGEAGAPQHRCLRAAARLPRMQVPTAPASPRTSFWGKEGGFYRKWVITDRADTVSVSHRLQSAGNCAKAPCNGRSMSASTFSISWRQITTASPEPNLISQINTECLSRELAGKGFVHGFPRGEKR